MMGERKIAAKVPLLWLHPHGWTKKEHLIDQVILLLTPSVSKFWKVKLVALENKLEP